MAKRQNEEQLKPEEQSKTQDNPGASGSTTDNNSSYVNAACRLSTAFPVGASRRDTNIVKIESLDISDTSTTPGICVISYIPTYGVSKDALSPLNRASFYEFNVIRSEISGNRPYQTVDHIIYRACTNSMRDLYAYIKRAYTVLATYNARNLYRPRAIMEAMGLDFDDWNRNAANVYQWLVNHANALQPFPVMPIGKITARREAYNTHFFTDGDASTAQTYIFNQYAFYSYAVVDEVKGMTLDRATDGTFAAFADLWDRMYEALQSSSDVYIIAADVRRAFKEKVITDLVPPSPTDAVSYTKLDPILTGIMNCAPVGAAAAEASAEDYASIAEAFVVKDGGNGILVCNPTWTQTITTGPDQANAVITAPVSMKHLNFVESEPDVTSIRNAVRFKPAINVTIDRSAATNDFFDAITVEVESCGTEVVLGTRYYALNADGSTLSSIPMSGSIIAGFSNVTKKLMSGIAMRACFDWAPPVSVIAAYTWENPSYVYTFQMEDIQNYVPISNDVLNNIHTACILAEFEIPE